MGTFQLDDDDDAFWGDDATFGQIDTLCRQAEARQAASQHASGSGATPLPVRRSETGGATTSPSPLRAPLRLEPGLGGPSQMQPHTSNAHAKPRVAVHPSDDSSGGGSRIPTGAPATAAAYRQTPFPSDAGSDPASLAAALRDKERQLGEKEAHLKMLRSRLEMAERDGETARRRLEASRLEREREKERERNAAAGANGGANANGGARGGGLGNDHAPYGHHDTTPFDVPQQQQQRNRNLDLRTRSDGPNPMDVSNAAALQEARAELARLRARVAFKDEEAEEARRREDEHRASLVRAEAEAMRLAAEVRRERRRAAAAESDAAAGKRRRDDVDVERVRLVGGDPARARGVSGASALPEAGDVAAAGGITAGVLNGARDLPAPPPAPPVSLVLPPPPPAAAAFPPDRAAGGAGGGAAAFAATVASAPAATRAILGFAASDFFFSWTTHANDKKEKARERGFAVSSQSDRVALAALRLRDVLSDLAADAATAASFAAAAADLVVAAAAELEHLEAFESSDRTDDPSVRRSSPKALLEASVSPRAWFLRTAARDAMFVLAACSKADVAAAEQIARLFGSFSVTGADKKSATLLAPRPPPEPLAGVPAAGTDGVGFLVPHPGVFGSRLVLSRVFAPAPPETVVDVPDDAVVGDGGDTRDEKLIEKLPRAGNSLNSPFLDAALLILSSSLSSGDWYAARSALRLLSRAAAEADPLRGRGVFAAAAAAGHLARALGGDGEKHFHRPSTHTIRGGGGTEGASADRLAGGLAAADAAGDFFARKGTHPVRIPPATFLSSHQRRRPPARVRRDALALARLLAGTPEFAASLSRGGGETGSVRGERLSLETTREKRRTRDATKTDARKKKNEPTRANAALDDDVSDVSGATLKNGEKSKPFSDDYSDEEEPDCPLLRAVVACVEEFAEDALDAEAEEAEASDDAFAVEDEVLRNCAYRRVGSGTRNENLDAALLTLAAISHADWPGWGDAVRRHGVLAAAVAAAEAAFAAAANAAASAADQRRLRHALMFVARLLAEPASARAASSALRRDGETCRRLARVARAANAHAEQMPRRVGKYLDSVLAAWS